MKLTRIACVAKTACGLVRIAFVFTTAHPTRSTNKPQVPFQMASFFNLRASYYVCSGTYATRSVIAGE